MPDISPETGEPAYRGETKTMVERLRKAAKVRTFDQAAGQCSYGKAASGLLVLNSSDQEYIWVGQPNRSFWAPRFAVHLSGH